MYMQLSREDRIAQIEKNAPEELRQINRWLLWASMDRDGKATKAPCHRGGRSIDPHNPNHWTTFNQVIEDLRASHHSVDGVAFVFSKDDDVMGIDIDDCLGIDGLHTSIDDLVRRMDTYTEISPGGHGLKLFMRGQKPGSRCKKSGVEGADAIEMYSEKRMFTVTGNLYNGAPRVVRANQVVIEDAYRRYCGEDAPRHKQSLPDWRPGASEAELLHEDELLLAKAKSSRGESFKALFDGDTSAYGDDHSAADLALCNMLAADCGLGRHEQVDRIFRHSGLIRPKWDEKHGTLTYGQMTVNKAYEGRYQVPADSPNRSMAGGGDAWSAAREEGLIPAGLTTADLGYLASCTGDLTTLLNLLRSQKLFLRTDRQEDGQASDLLIQHDRYSEVAPKLLAGRFADRRLVAGTSDVYAWNAKESHHEVWPDATC